MKDYNLPFRDTGPLDKLKVTGPEPSIVTDGSWTLSIWGERGKEIVFYEMLEYSTHFEREEVDKYIEILSAYLGLIWNGKEYTNEGE